MKDFWDIINDEVGPTDTILDIGSGNCRGHDKFKHGHITTVDAWEKVKPHYIIDLEVNDLPFEDSSFDIVFMIDFIEHLNKDRGFKIIEQAQKICRKKIILLTPLWWDENNGKEDGVKSWEYGNTYNTHKSLWGTNDFKEWIRYSDVKEHWYSYFYGAWYR